MLYNQDTFFAVVRLGLGHDVSYLPETYEWELIENLANQQGLSAIILDGIEKLPVSKKPPKEQLLKLIGEVLRNYEYRHDIYKKLLRKSLVSIIVMGLE